MPSCNVVANGAPVECMGAPELGWPFRVEAERLGKCLQGTSQGLVPGSGHILGAEGNCWCGGSREPSVADIPNPWHGESENEVSTLRGASKRPLRALLELLEWPRAHLPLDFPVL